VTNTDGRIVTRQLFLEGPYGGSLTAPRSVYVMPLLPLNGAYFSRPNDAEAAPGVPQYFSGPGLAFGFGQTFASGSNLQLTFTDGLKLWDGGGFSDPGDEQIRAFRGSFASPTATAVTSDLGPFAVLNFPPIPASYNAEAHNSARFVLLGDGTDPLAPSDDGVYLLSMQLLSTDSTVGPSDPFYFVLYKNAGLSEAMDAARALGFDRTAIQVVPEAGGAGLVLLGTLAAGVAALVRRRRACRAA
jgi:hypothetical protein